MVFASCRRIGVNLGDFLQQFADPLGGAEGFLDLTENIGEGSH